MNGSGDYAKDGRQSGKRVRAAGFGVKSLMAVMAPPGLSSHDSHRHGGHGTQGNCVICQAWR